MADYRRTLCNSRSHLSLCLVIESLSRKAQYHLQKMEKFTCCREEHLKCKKCLIYLKLQKEFSDQFHFCDIVSPLELRWVPSWLGRAHSRTKVWNSIQRLYSFVGDSQRIPNSLRIADYLKNTSQHQLHSDDFTNSPLSADIQGIAWL